MNQESKEVNWCEIVWRDASDIYDAIIAHPFIRELQEGTLSRERYLYYLSQDKIYLGQYFRVLAHIASRIEPADFADDFLRFATDGILVERNLHSFFLDGESGKQIVASPSCALYTSTLKSMAYEPMEVEAASVLPCFMVYYRVGCHIYNHASKVSGHPYRKWIDTYADKSFKTATERAMEICNILASRTTDEIRNRMTAIFRYCTKMEYLFWDSAWKLEKWKI
ncbi:MAG: TenA family protein [Muribaculaceae bacterium]|nr:TenA family protein [Muribaculaceae bacterium]